MCSSDLKLVPVPRTPTGPDVAALEAVCASFRPKAFFTQTLLQNPTNSSMDAATAFAVLQLAQRHDMLVVEDDIYGDLHPGGNPLRLAQADRLQRVIYLGGFSKVLSPNIRVGFVAAAPHFIRLFSEHKLLSVLTTSELDERLVHAVLSSGGYRKHVERVRQRLAGHRGAVVRGLRNAGLEPQENGTGGLFVWARLPEGVDPELLARDAEENGILLAPGTLFVLRQSDHPWLRFNVATADNARLFDYLGSRIAALRAGAVNTGTGARPVRDRSP